MSSQVLTRVIIHETTSILPCRGGGGGVLHSLSPRDIAFSGGLNGWMRQSYHFQYRWIYGMGVLKRYVCIGFYPLDRQFLSAGGTHFLAWPSEISPPATPALEPQVAPIDQKHVELHVGGHRAGGRSLFARNVRRLPPHLRRAQQACGSQLFDMISVRRCPIGTRGGGFMGHP
jgi:hypothetical protein